MQEGQEENLKEQNSEIEQSHLKLLSVNDSSQQAGMKRLLHLKSVPGTREGALHAHVEYVYKKYNFCLRLALPYSPLVFFTVC